MTTLTRNETAQFLLEHDNYLILSHRRPDGDTTGSSAALCLGLRQLGKTAYVLKNKEVSDRLRWLHEGLTKSAPEGNETIVSTDVASPSLLPENAQPLLGKLSLRIDHHGSAPSFTDLELVEACKKNNMGFIAMKALSGGLITNSAAAYAFEARFDNVLPIWGIQRERELDEFLSYIENPPVMTEEIRVLIENDRKQLFGSFCRGCGYCMPCPVGIEINTCARMSLLLRRSPSKNHLSEAGQAKMMKIKDCLHCNQCMGKCPYGLNTPELLARNLKDYEEILAGKEMTPTNF